MNRTKQQTGKKGEELAQKFLEQKGFLLLRKNYRYLKSEIDLIMQKDDLLIFVEVKMRKNADYGYPEEFVSDEQLERIMDASEEFMEEVNWNEDVRYDIISILSEGKEILHFEGIER